MDISEKFQTDFNTMQRLLNLVSKIDTYKGKWSTIETKENVFLKDLRYIATIESVGSSTRIEGGTMTDDEIAKLLKNIKITPLNSRDSQEVVGYYEALETIIDAGNNIFLTESNIKSLHNILLKYSSKDNRHKGNYKMLSNKVVANYPDGTQKVIFNTTEPHLVGKEMEALLQWTNTAFSSGEIHPLFIIGSFVYEFLSIHPFQDGNGRLSRLLTTLLLISTGYDFVKYVSFENIIEERKSDYYQALIVCQKNRNNPNERINEWLLFFLDCLLVLTQRLDEKYDVFKQKGGYLNERQKQVFEFIKANSPVKISDIKKAFPDISRNTLKKDLLYFRSENRIKAIGKGKGLFYDIPK